MRKVLAVILMLAGGAVAQQTCPVAVRATVLDRAEAVRGLTQADFVVKIGGREARVFSAEIAVTPRFFLVLDASGSVAGSSTDPAKAWKIVLAQAADIVSKAPQGTAMGVLSFGGKLERRLDLTQNPSLAVQQILREGASLRNPPTMTSLWDALLHAGDRLQRGDFIVVLTDGADNNSRMDRRKLGQFLARQGIRVYPILSADMFPRTEEEREGPGELSALADATGGRLLSMEHAESFYGHPEKIGPSLERVSAKLWDLTNVSYVLRVGAPAEQEPKKLKITVRDGSGQRTRLRVFHADTIAPCEAGGVQANSGSASQ